MAKYYFFSNDRDNNEKGINNLFSIIKNGQFLIDEVLVILDTPQPDSRGPEKVKLEGRTTLLYEHDFAYPDCVVASRDSWRDLIQQMESADKVNNLTFDGQRFKLNDIIDTSSFKNIEIAAFLKRYPIEDKFFRVAVTTNAPFLEDLEWVMRISDLRDLTKEQFLKEGRASDGGPRGVKILGDEVLLRNEMYYDPETDEDEDEGPLYPLNAFWDLWLRYKKEVLEKTDTLSLYQIAWNGKTFDLYVEYNS